MAVPKKAAPKKRRTPAKTTQTRRRSQPRKKGFLSEAISKKNLTGAARGTLYGALAAGGAIGLDYAFANQTQTGRGWAQVIGGFVVAAIAKAPLSGAGLSGIGFYNVAQGSGFLADDGYGTQFADPIQNLPATLPMALNDDGEMMYLQDGEEMYLQEDGGGYPSYLPGPGGQYDYGA